MAKDPFKWHVGLTSSGAVPPIHCRSKVVAQRGNGGKNMLLQHGGQGKMMEHPIIMLHLTAPTHQEYNHILHGPGGIDNRWDAPHYWAVSSLSDVPSAVGRIEPHWLAHLCVCACGMGRSGQPVVVVVVVVVDDDRWSMMMMMTTTTFLFTLERIHTSVLIINLRMFAGIKHKYIYILYIWRITCMIFCYCLCINIRPLCPHKTWVSADPCWAARAKAPSNARLSSRLRGGKCEVHGMLAQYCHYLILC